MKNVVETVTCDVCGDEFGEDGFSLTIPIRWLTEQTEGKFCKPYYQSATIDICEKCANDALRIEAIGAQGCRKYRIKMEGGE